MPASYSGRAKMRRVVITGMGIISSIGNSIPEVLNSLKNGISGIEFIPGRKELGFRSSIGGTIKNFSIPNIEKRYLRQMGPGSYLAVHATQQALASSGLKEEEIQSEDMGIIIGNAGNMRDIYEQCDSVFRKTKKLGGGAYQKVMACTVSANLSVWLKTRGYAMTVSAACATGAASIGYAYQLIKWGLQERCICGGVQEDSWESICHFDALKAFSLREDEPKKASRPFDKYRDGLVPSCGAGIIVLEEYEKAKKRNAKIYAEVIGYAFSADGYDMTIPSGDGSVRCMEKALKEAGINAEDVDYINAHATSTTVGDKVEAQGIAKILGNHPHVSSTKSMTGHELGAAGSNELIYTLLMMEDSFVAPNINIEEIDPDCKGINIVANEAIPAKIDIALSNSFGFGGVNTCLVVKRL